MLTLEQLQKAQTILDEWNASQSLRNENGITLTFVEYIAAIAEYDKREAEQQHELKKKEFAEKALPLLEDVQKHLNEMQQSIEKFNDDSLSRDLAE